MITKLIALTFVFFSSVISASEFGASVALTKITYGNDSHVSWLSVNVDEQNNINGFSFHKFLENELLASQEYGSYINYAGVTLEYKKEHEYLVLRGLNVSVYNGGAVELDFLFNSLTNSRAIFAMELDRTSDGWQLTQNGKIIKWIHLVPNFKAGFGEIGIKEIQILR